MRAPIASLLRLDNAQHCHSGIGNMTQEPSRHGIAEHHEMDELVEKLEDTEASSPAWIAVTKALYH